MKLQSCLKLDKILDQSLYKILYVPGSVEQKKQQKTKARNQPPAHKNHLQLIHYSVKRLYKIRVNPDLVPFLLHFESLRSHEGGFLCLRDFFGEMLTLDKRRGYFLANRGVLCGEDEEKVDHIIVDCLKVRMLWNIILTLVVLICAFSSTVRDPSNIGMVLF